MADNIHEPEYWQFVPIIILWVVWCTCVGGAICSFTCCTSRCYNSFDWIRRESDRRMESRVNLSYVPAISSNQNLTVEGILVDGLSEISSNQNTTTVEGVLDEEENAV